MTRWFALQQGLRGPVSVVFNERPVPGHGNAEKVIPGTIKQVPAYLDGAELAWIEVWAERTPNWVGFDEPGAGSGVSRETKRQQRRTAVAAALATRFPEIDEPDALVKTDAFLAMLDAALRFEDPC